MLISSDVADLRLIGFYLGRIMTGLGVLQLLPMALAVLLADWNDVTALAVGASLALTFGHLARWRLRSSADLSWSGGMVTVALGWLVGSLLVAVPLYLSGHYGVFVDAWFDAMSGLTTSGLALIQDLDHLSPAMNLLRHLTHFVGGQGIVVVVLTVLTTSGAQVSTLYVGEGRDDRIVPNVVRTARFIYFIALDYLVLGTLALWVSGLVAGLTPLRSLFHAVNLFMAAFDTGGFSPYSSSMAYYHSAAMEGVVIVLMVAGTLAFGLHHQLWRGRFRAVLTNLEVRTLAVTGGLVAGICVLGLGRAGTFTDVTPLLRKGVFTIISAHTGTGFAVNPGRLFVTDWGPVAPAAVVLAMALGGMASSTAGGIKAVRVGLAAKSVGRDLRRAIQPDAAVVTSSYGARPRQLVTDERVSGAMTILVLFLLTYVLGALVGVYHGVPFEAALFESTSAGANVGLSAGVLAPDNPLSMKLVYLVQMWLGRLEFMAAFVLLGWIVALARGRR